MKYLFLGGSLDGKKLGIDSDKFVVRYMNPTIPLYEFSTKRSQEIYTRHKLAGSSRTFEVFAPMLWTGDMILERLLQRASRTEPLPEESS